MPAQTRTAFYLICVFSVAVAGLLSTAFRRQAEAAGKRIEVQQVQDQVVAVPRDVVAVEEQFAAGSRFGGRLFLIAALASAALMLVRQRWLRACIELLYWLAIVGIAVATAAADGLFAALRDTVNTGSASAVAMAYISRSDQMLLTLAIIVTILLGLVIRSLRSRTMREALE